MAIIKRKLDAGQYNLKDQVVSINRVTKVVKGGKNMSFAALVVVGDPGAAVVGYGSGKAKEVPQAIRKGIEAAKKNLVHVNLSETTIPHQVLGRFGSGHVLDRKSTRLNSSHQIISYAVFCLKKKKKYNISLNKICGTRSRRTTDQDT